jgi:hypothetical protein
MDIFLSILDNSTSVTLHCAVSDLPIARVRTRPDKGQCWRGRVSAATDGQLLLSQEWDCEIIIKTFENPQTCTVYPNEWHVSYPLLLVQNEAP